MSATTSSRLGSAARWTEQNGAPGTDRVDIECSSREIGPANPPSGTLVLSVSAVIDSDGAEPESGQEHGQDRDGRNSGGASGSSAGGQ